MHRRPIRLVTRGSRLAMWQAERVAALLRAHVQDQPIIIVREQTLADRNPHWNLLEHGGKGLFVRELEEALLDDRADIAIHSLKDMALVLPEGLVLAAVLARHEARDTLIWHPSVDGATGDSRPLIIGTSSQRRLYQLRQRFPKAQFRAIRGNIDTRIRKCQALGDYDAIVLSAVGLDRLKLDVSHQPLAVTDCIPAVGQGVIALQCRSDDQAMRDLAAKIHHAETGWCTALERRLASEFEVGCQQAFAAHGCEVAGRRHLYAGFGDPKSGCWQAFSWSSQEHNWQDPVWCEWACHELELSGIRAALAG